jgi:hypothetical protein
VDFVTFALSNAETLMFGRTPFEVASRTVPFTAKVCPMIVRWLRPLTF